MASETSDCVALVYHDLRPAPRWRIRARRDTLARDVPSSLRVGMRGLSTMLNTHRLLPGSAELALSGMLFTSQRCGTRLGSCHAASASG